MKKVLFASTALVMTAGVAAADITFSGSANMGIKSNAHNGKFDGTSAFTDDTQVTNEIDFDIKGSGETDGGLSFGASVDIDASSANSAHKQDSTDFDPEVFVAYNGLKLTVGNIGEANDIGGVRDIGFDGIGIDDVVDDLRENGSDDVRVDYAFGDFAVALSADSATDQFALSVSGNVDAFKFSAAFRDNNTAGDNDANVTVGYTAGAISVGATYAKDGVLDTNGWGVDAAYTTGDITVSAVYAKRDGSASTQESTGFGIGVAYDLGGATLAGGVGRLEVGSTTETVADLGISFSF